MELDTLCPLLSIGKKKPIMCRSDCEWFTKTLGEERCAILKIAEKLDSIETSMPSY